MQRAWPKPGSHALRNRRRPTLPGRIQPSTIGAGGLNFRVRNGNGYLSAAMATEISCSAGEPRSGPFENSIANTSEITSKIQALGRLVPVS
jgi:hypothetical protein